MKIAIIQYGSGNVRSVENALLRLGIEPLLTYNQSDILSADGVILPGQGEAATAMEYLKKRNLDQLILSLKQPVLGICIGQQLLCRHSDEGDVDCLGVFDADVRRLNSTLHEQKVPHMGWNTIQTDDNDLLYGVHDMYVYYVHSYYVPVCKHTIATTHYIHPFSAAMRKDNYFATQFHPEKSGVVGELILRNFLKYL